MPAKTTLSGFPEWLPEERLVEQIVLDTLRSQFELYGYRPLETRLFEPLSRLLGKGEDVNKEVYGIRRVNGEGGDAAEVGLHFDLTVPLARYVVENAGKLTFPFARYQIQKVYRGERAQEGRFREFYQADVDVIGKGELSPHYDAEIPLLIAGVLAALPLPPFRVEINNRKICQGFYETLGIADTVPVLRVIDKLKKIGADSVRTVLTEKVGCTSAQADACLQLASIRTTDLSFVEQVRGLGVGNATMDAGIAELADVMTAARRHLPEGAVVVNIAISRGLDYYSGNVFEGFIDGHEDLGAVCAGGRYDNLAITDDGTRYPGTGISFGVSRMLSRLFAKGMWSASRPTPTCVLVTLPSDDQRDASSAVAAQLRARGIATEVAPSAAKLGAQIKDADRRGIPFVWIGETGVVKDIRSGEQREADPATWSPPDQDLHARITSQNIAEDRHA